jgi:hypothetical protein
MHSDQLLLLVGEVKEILIVIDHINSWKASITEHSLC